MNKLLFSTIIVAFNPDERLLKSVKNLMLSEYVKDIFVVDNSTSTNEFIEAINHFPKVTVISNNGNKGIAYAQDVGIKESQKKGYNWALTLDHDTILEPSLLNKYFDFIKSNNYYNIGIVATDYIDIGIHAPAFNCSEPLEVAETISSGSLLNIDIYNRIGGFKINYFIDQVDNEYCYRLQKNGYKIIVLPGIGMEHRLGKMQRSSLLGHPMILYNQSPLRTYYRTRNIIWFLREYHDMSLWKSKITDLLKDPVRFLFEDKTLSKFYFYVKGLLHGIVINYEKTF